MNMAVLIPIALGLGLIALAAFFWSLRSGQYEDLDGAAERVLLNDTDELPKPNPAAITAGRASGAPTRTDRPRVSQDRLHQGDQRQS